MVEIIFQIFTSAVILAALNLSIINIFKNIYNDCFLLCERRKNKEHLNKTKSNLYIYKRKLTRLLTIISGILLSIFTKVSIMELFHIPIMAFKNDSVNKALEYIITGLIISRGSNMLYDLIDKVKNINKKDDNKSEAEETADNGIKDDSLTVYEE